MRPAFDKLLTLLCVGSLAILASTSCKDPKPDPEPKEEVAAEPVTVKVIALNDLHGHMEGPSGKVKLAGERVEAGGLDAMATHLEAIRAKNPNHAFVCAGDLVGASPLISALFHDEPTVEAMNKLGLDFLAVGNHEFDEGVDELLRLQKGGCHPEDGCQGKDSYEGAQFSFLAANVIVKETGKTLFPAYGVKEFGAVKVGFIGLTLEGTPDATSPAGIKTVSFLDEAESINKAAKELQGQGVEAIVVVIHEGAIHENPDAYKDINDCPGLVGPIVEINENLDPSIDAIVAGHTHQAFNCELEGRLLTSAKSYGRVLTEIDLTIDPKTGDVIEKKAVNVATTRDGALDASMASHIGRYRELVRPLAQKPVGNIAKDILRATDEDGYSQLAGIIADAQVSATSAPDMGGAQFALMNLGGVRNDMIHKSSPAGEGDGVVTYEEVFSVQPFGNTLVVLEITGAQLEQLLEMQWQGQDRVRMLQPSSQLSYSWSETDGDHIAPEDILYMGKPVDPNTTYKVTVNSFLASGGDGFSLLAELKQAAGGPIDADAFVDYMGANSPLDVKKSRITKK
jgi:5'-nucleotidase